MRDIKLPPYAPILIESTRSIGYSLQAAIADIIDNSITAFASNIDIFYLPTTSYIAILDDGCGMNADEIESAMRYGSKNPIEKRFSNDLGRFGLGLKTASLSQCRTLTVASIQKGHIEARCWDIDHVIATQDWSLLILETDLDLNRIPCIEKLKELETGTLVVWQNLDRLQIGALDFSRAMSKKMDDVREHLSLVFHRYINGEQGLKRVLLSMNDLPVEGANPFLTHRNTKVMADEEINIEGAKVIVSPYILPHLSSLSVDEINLLGGKEGLRRKQGFYIYRNKRLLIWGTWFNMMRRGELSKLARVQVDIPNELDNLWTLDIKKSIAVPPEIVRNNLNMVISRLAERSKRTWEFRGKKETCDSVTHIWSRNKGRQGGFFYSINREHPLFTMFEDIPLQMKRNLEMLLHNIETGIPLNQLYLDLTSEKQVENETDTTLPDVEAMLQGLVDQMPNSTAKSILLERLAVAEPFVNYPALITRYQLGETESGGK